MKKLIALILAVMMIASLSVTAFAAEHKPENGTSSETGDVNVNVTASDGSEITDEDIKKIYFISIAWEDLNYTFKADQEKTALIWDAVNHVYSNMTGAWLDNSRDVVVTNHSNDEIKVVTAFTNNTLVSDELNKVTAKLENADIENGAVILESATGTTTTDAPKTTYVVSVAGVPNTLDSFKVDTITVQLSPA